VRVGDYAFDNTHQFRGYQYGRANTVSSVLPIEDDSFALRSLLWLKTDQGYKQAAETLLKVKANSTVNLEGEDKSDDFSHDKPVVYLEPPASIEIDVAAWETRLRALSLPFRNHPEILGHTVSIATDAETRYFASTQGSRLQLPSTHARVMVYAW